MIDLLQASRCTKVREGVQYNTAPSFLFTLTTTAMIHDDVMDDQEKGRIYGKLERSIAHRRLSVFEVAIGMICQRIILFRGKDYDPHLEDCEVIFIYWNKGVTDFSDYYRKEEDAK